MTNIRRYFEPGQTCFLTHVTYDRTPILVDNADLLRQSIQTVLKYRQMEVIAWVILPDHIHLLLNSQREDIPEAMHIMKQKFSALYRSRHRLQSGRLWQNRYWDHIIRDEADFRRHVNYIHFNPVKHGIEASAYAYEHSSFREFVKNGYFEETWGAVESEFHGNTFGE